MLKSIYKQFGNPKGFLGGIVGFILAKKNKERIDWLISEMKIKPGDKILEIGYGPGVAIKNIASRLTTGAVTGIEISDVMMRQASKRNKEEIKNGKVKLIKESIDNLDVKERFNKIFGMNVHIFWKNPVEELKRLKNLLNESGKLTIALQPRYAKTERMVITEAEKTKNYFREAGLKIVKFSMLPLKPQAVFYVAGVNINNSEN